MTSNATTTENYWDVLDYSVEQRFEALHLISQYPPGTLKNALVESYLLHTRILMDILLSRTRRIDDVRLTDLLEPGALTEVLQRKVAELENAYGTDRQEYSLCWRLNKQLAHPTTNRIEGFDWGRELNPIEPLIFQTLHLVAKATTSERTRATLGRYC